MSFSSFQSLEASSFLGNIHTADGQISQSTTRCQAATRDSQSLARLRVFFFLLGSQKLIQGLIRGGSKTNNPTNERTEMNSENTSNDNLKGTTSWWSRLKSAYRHLTSTNTGEVEVWHVDNKIMCGFRCDDCGQLHSVHEISTPATTL